MSENVENLYPLYHRIDEGGCGEIAIFTTRVLVEGDELDGNLFRRLNGSIPIDGFDDMICEHCGLPILPGFDCVYEIVA